MVVVEVRRIADPCGFAVPIYEHKGSPSRLIDDAEKKGSEGMENDKAQKNRASIDGIAELRGDPTERFG